MKPFKCTRCPNSFSRAEHLERHAALHTGERPHKCPCGRAFSRSDAFSRHSKGCGAGEATTASDKRISGSRPRRACDQCARLKSKCGSGSPCYSCVSRGINCSYNGRPDQRSNALQPAALDTPAASDARDDAAPDSMLMTRQVPADGSAVDGDGPAASTGGSPPIFWVDRPDGDSPYDLGRESFSQQSALTSELSWDFYMPALPLCPPFVADGASNLTLEPFNPHSRELSTGKKSEPGFSSLLLEQLDPLQAKCSAIQTLLGGPGPEVPEDVVASSINRDNLLKALQLFGRNFQRHIPLLHAPTFDLATASPLLVLSMFTVGSCYADIVRPAKYLFPMATRVLVHLEKQQHEIELTEPPLSAIQASIAACSVLGSSRDETAHVAFPLYFARSISMAKRAAIFDARPPVDYTMSTQETFDWRLWVERETRIRIANVLFTQDVASCILLGTSPTFSPLHLDIELPCYEVGWNSRSAQACLQHLQSAPPQRTLASTFSQLQTASSQLGQDPQFEVSAFGMFTLVNALHCLIWDATHYDLHKSDRNPSLSLRLKDLDRQIAGDFSGPNIVQLAARAVQLRNSSSFDDINRALDGWLAVWEKRTWRDADYENIAFALDPLPFWLLAKLFVLLHCGKDCFSSQSEFKMTQKTAVSSRDSLSSQAKIYRWLSMLRQNAVDRDRPPVDSLASLMGPM